MAITLEQQEAADAAYDGQDQAWFDALSTEVLVAMWELCCDIERCPSWDDEVYEALYKRGHFKED